MTSAWIAELAKGLTAGTQAYQSADQDRKARAKQDFEMGVTLLDPDMATSAFAEMQAPDPVSRWIGSAMGQKLPDTSKQGAAIGKYLAMKRKEQEAALLKAQMAGLKNPMRLGQDAPVVTPVAQSLPPTTDQPLPLGTEAAMPEPQPPSGTSYPPDLGAPPQLDMAAPTLSVMDYGGLGQLSGPPPAMPVAGPPQTPSQTILPAPSQPVPAEAQAVIQESTPSAGNYVLPGVTVGNPMGLVEPGNIDLSSFGAIKSPKGNISTVDSFAFKDGDRYVLLPLAANGETIQKEEAVGNYFRDGKKNLGTFATPEAAEDYRVKLHEQQATAYGQPQQAPPAPVAPPPVEPALILPTGPIPVAGNEAFGEEPIDQRWAEIVRAKEKEKGQPQTTDFTGISMADAKEYLTSLETFADTDKNKGETPIALTDGTVALWKRHPDGSVTIRKGELTTPAGAPAPMPEKPAPRPTVDKGDLVSHNDGPHKGWKTRTIKTTDAKGNTTTKVERVEKLKPVEAFTQPDAKGKYVRYQHPEGFPGIENALPGSKKPLVKYQAPPQRTPKEYTLEQAKKDATIETEAALGYPRPKDSILEGVKQKRWDREYQKQLQKKRAEKHVAAPKPLSAEARQLAETIGFDLTGMA